MSDTKKPIFVPKHEADNAVELGLDEAIALCVKLQNEANEAKKVIDNVKAVIKDHLKAQNLTKHETPEGHRAAWSESKREQLDKEGVRDLLGEDYTLVSSYKTVKSFKVS